MSTATTTATPDDDQAATAAVDAEIAETRSHMERLAALIPGLEARRAEAADRKRRSAVIALRERIEPTIGTEIDELRTAMRALEKATADVLTAGNMRNTRISGDVTAMTEVSIPPHPQGNAPMPSPEYAGLGYSRRSDGASIVVDLRHEHVISPARLVDMAVSSGKRVADGSDPDTFGVLDGLVTTVQPKATRYFVVEVDLSGSGRRDVRHQVAAFDAAQVDGWAEYEHRRFVAEITEEEAWRIGWGLARVEPRTAGGVEVVAVEASR